MTAALRRLGNDCPVCEGKDCWGGGNLRCVAAKRRNSSACLVAGTSHPMGRAAKRHDSTLRRLPANRFSHVVTLSLGSPFRLHRTLSSAPPNNRPTGPAGFTRSSTMAIA